MVILRPLGVLPSAVIQHKQPESKKPAFVIHPPTHLLASQLVVDSTALQDENYSGVYDEKGDYVPQYCDNPEDIPQGAMQPNSDPSPASPGGTADPSQNTIPESSPESDKPE